MKRIIAISAVLVCLGSTGARAEEPSGIWRNTVLRETAIRNSLWLESSSAAGLAFSPYKVFNVLDLSYDGGYGEFRKNGTGKSSTVISLNTSGAAYIGKFLTTGGFSTGTLANTTLSIMCLTTNWRTICPTILLTTSPADGRNRNIS